MKRFLTPAIFIPLIASLLQAQEDSTKKFGISLTGFVRSDVIYDSRQSEILRESAILLYPKNREPDRSGRDANAHPTLAMIVLNTRLGGNITGPDAFGASSSAYIEGEFFGVSDLDANGFRVRHAYALLDWGGTELMAGQFWHPMFVTDVAPAFNFGAPFIAYSRNPQIRLTQRFGGFSLALTALSQSDFRSIGPDASGKPVRNITFIKNAALPGLDLQCAYRSGGLIAGAGADVKWLLPRLADEKGVSDRRIASYAGTAFLRIDAGLATVKFQGIYGQNLPDLYMLGGYAPRRDDSTRYTNYNVASLWAECVTGSTLQIRLFAGYTTLLGTADPALANPNKLYAMGWNIDDLFRVAPSVQVISGNVRAVAELEYTTARYGSRFVDDQLRLDDLHRVNNLRADVAVYYTF